MVCFVKAENDEKEAYVYKKIMEVISASYIGSVIAGKTKLACSDISDWLVPHRSHNADLVGRRTKINQINVIWWSSVLAPNSAESHNTAVSA